MNTLDQFTSNVEEIKKKVYLDVRTETYSNIYTGNPVTDILLSIGRTEINTCIETGTFMGNTTAFLSALFEKVYTVEKYITQEKADNYKKIHSACPNIDFYNGDTIPLLSSILDKTPDMTFAFWLDAHNGVSEVPLIEELETIAAKSNKKDHVILIDDGLDMGQGNFPTFDEISNAALKINPNYNIIQTNYIRNIIAIY